MKLSVIIPTYKRHEDLFICLDSIDAQSRTSDEGKRFESEIVISDDEQSSDLQQKLEARYNGRVRWLAGPSKGPASNRNNGARASTGEWLIFLDDDCIPQDNLLDEYFRHMEKDVEILEGKIDVDRPKERYNEKSPINLTGGFLWSCNFAIRRDVFDALNGFDEDYPFAALEDVDFRERAKNSRYQILFIESASVIHPWRIVSGHSMLQKRLKSHAILWSKLPQLEPKNRLWFFLRKVFRDSVKQVIPNLFRYRARGLGYEMMRLSYISCWAILDCICRRTRGSIK